MDRRRQEFRGNRHHLLSISESTVNFHHKNIQKKFDAPNKTLAAAYAAALGLI